LLACRVGEKPIFKNPANMVSNGIKNTKHLIINVLFCRFRKLKQYFMTAIKDLSSFKKTGSKLYDIQPSWCRKPLDLINNNAIILNPIVKRVFFFDPTHIYDKINQKNLLNPYQRRCSVPMSELFEDKNGKCACGCGKQLEGRRKRWTTDECNSFANMVFQIISGDATTLRMLRSRYAGGYNCEICGMNDYNEVIELDHIFPVKFGGGGGWLSNYQFKCKKCHREKTNADFGFKKPKVLETLPLFT
jgi:5-methylcytosine-specific restriction endonuclease McrA